MRGGALLAAALPIQISQRAVANATVSDDGFVVLERYVAGVSGHDAGAIGACVAPDYLQHSGRSPSGREALEMVFRGLFAGLPDVRLSVEDRLAAGDRVVARCTYRGTHLGTLFGIAPTQRTVQFGTIDTANKTGTTFKRRSRKSTFISITNEGSSEQKPSRALSFFPLKCSRINQRSLRLPSCSRFILSVPILQPRARCRASSRAI